MAAREGECDVDVEKDLERSNDWGIMLLEFDRLLLDRYLVGAGILGLARSTFDLRVRFCFDLNAGTWDVSGFGWDTVWYNLSVEFSPTLYCFLELFPLDKAVDVLFVSAESENVKRLFERSLIRLFCIAAVNGRASDSSTIGGLAGGEASDNTCEPNIIERVRLILLLEKDMMLIDFLLPVLLAKLKYFV